MQSSSLVFLVDWWIHFVYHVSVGKDIANPQTIERTSPNPEKNLKSSIPHGQICLRKTRTYMHKTDLSSFPLTAIRLVSVTSRCIRSASLCTCRSSTIRHELADDTQMNNQIPIWFWCRESLGVYRGHSPYAHEHHSSQFDHHRNEKMALSHTPEVWAKHIWALSLF